MGQCQSEDKNSYPYASWDIIADENNIKNYLKKVDKFLTIKKTIDFLQSYLKNHTNNHYQIVSLVNDSETRNTLRKINPVGRDPNCPNHRIFIVSVMVEIYFDWLSYRILVNPINIVA